MISGNTYGGCKILCESGSGAYGTVYLAKDALNRTVAIKVFHATGNLTRNIDGLRKCITSFKDNEGILKIFHCGFDDDHIFYVMEAADNATPDKAYTPDTLAYRLREGRRLSLDESLAICRSIAITCQKLHSQGMIHRDLKPENVIFVNGQPKVGDLDFLSDYNRTMSLVGSIGFIPPEFLSLQSLPKSTATDLYAIGKLFYCCVTGMPPEAYPKLPDDLPVDILYKICIPLSKLCSKKTSDRPATCEELLALLADARQPLSKATFRQRMALFFTMRPWLRHAIDIFLLVAILTFVVFRATTWHRRSMERKREEAILKTKRQKVNDVRYALKLSDGYLESNVLNDFKQKMDEAASINDYKEIGKMDDALQQMQSFIVNKSNEMRFMKSLYNSSSFDEKLRNLDTAFAFIHSPLARTILDGSMLRNLEDALFFHAKNVYSDMPFGSDFKIGNLYFQFVPSKNASSPRGFWIMQHDISHESFYQICKYRRLDGMHGAEHVENLCLNDMLACSRAVKMQIDKKLRMLPGYIVRPPTAGELERFFEFTAWGGTTAS